MSCVALFTWSVRMGAQPGWPAIVSDALGPLINTLFVRQARLKALLFQPPGSYESYKVAEGPNCQRRLEFTVAGTTLTLVLQPGCKSSRVVMDKPTQEWASDKRRLSSEVVDFLNAIRAAVGMEPYNAAKEPWSPLR